MTDIFPNLSPMLAKPFNGGLVNHIVMPKLNGLRAVYWRGSFYSRDGKRWNDGVLGHIKPPETLYPLDGELYAHGMPLQDIQDNVALANKQPGPDAECVLYYIYDTQEKNITALQRQENVDWLFKHQRVVKNCVPIEWFVKAGMPDCLDKYRQSLIDLNYEGMMLKAPLGHYFHSDFKNRRSDNLLKIKFTQDGEYKLVSMASGEGKAADCVATMTFQTDRGYLFEVGTFRASYEQRKEWLVKRAEYSGRKAKLQYVTLSNDGIPLNGSFIAWE